MMMNWVVAAFRSQVTDNNFSFETQRLWNSLHTNSFKYFFPCPSVTLEHFNSKHYPTWCRRLVGRTFVGRLSIWRVFSTHLERNGKSLSVDIETIRNGIKRGRNFQKVWEIFPGSLPIKRKLGAARVLKNISKFLEIRLLTFQVPLFFFDTT